MEPTLAFGLVEVMSHYIGLAVSSFSLGYSVAPYFFKWLRDVR